MRLATFLGLLLLGSATCAPTSSENDKVLVTEEFFPDELVVYTAQHDIVNIYVPLNALNFEEDDNEDTRNTASANLFFVEADIKDDGAKEYKGLYILKKGNATKLLDNGRDMTTVNEDTKVVYFGATDGIYAYNAETNAAEKYGSVTDNIAAIAKENNGDAIYALTEDKKLYKITEEGNKKVQIDDVKNAEQIVLDLNNNLYFYADKKAFIINSDGVKTIAGFPENPEKVTLVRPPFVIEQGIPAIVDNKGYIIYANGSCEVTDFEFKVHPTAYSMEATLIQYYGYNKKIYEYNILLLVLSETLKQLSEYLNGNKDAIQQMASRSRNDLRTNAI